MRSIKYRAFHKELKVMRDVCEINIAYKEVVVSHVKENGWTERNVWFKDEFELMQFTGLHDRNGKKIYEGDILQGYEWNDDYSLRNVPAYKYNISSKLVTSCGCCTPIHGWKVNDVSIEEVIGNIHENVGLL